MFADDVILYTSAKTVHELNSKLQECTTSVSEWYKGNALSANNTKSSAMILGSKSYLRDMSPDDFTIYLDSQKLKCVENEKYLGLTISNDLSWDEHILGICKSMNYYLYMLRSLRKILPASLLMKIYNSYVQSKLDYGISIWGCTTETNLNKIQRIQNLAARIITGNFDYINTRGIDIVESLNIQTIRVRRDYFLCTLMYKCVNGFAPIYLCDVTMHADIHDHDTRSSRNKNLYVPRPYKEIYKRSFKYKASQLWNVLPCYVRNQQSIDCFKREYKKVKGW